MEEEKTNVIRIKRARQFSEKCRHMKMTVSETKNTIECDDCGAQLNPIWVLGRYASEESLLYDRIARSRELSKKLDKRMRTKCDHCGEMTNIRVKL